ncbi:class I SAM-dependent methyltransferase [Nocardioides rubriscoriae]|uniref:class I SAM-dependent methyltransferase n=1 Tax=Nocardioides rubriscoriae TaxID=642762 RepID=UPI0011DFD33F|nr:class I SAM-dependent methyltransferase [Nocardioides rubriscoriae]
MTDRDHVARQYRDDQHLATRISVWHPTADGRDPATEALAAVVAGAPHHVLEIGCGTGAFAARLADALPDAAVVPVDQSAHLVAMTATRGLEARVADAQDLPFADDAFDAVAALWMLYHVPDLHRALAEARRVLRPGGTFVAVTNGDEHVADLRRDAGGGPVLTHFSSENGEVALRAHFDDVRRDDLVTRAAFPDRDAALTYLDSSQEDVAWSLPRDGWPREYAGHVTVFVAR